MIEYIYYGGFLCCLIYIIYLDERRDIPMIKKLGDMTRKQKIIKQD